MIKTKNEVNRVRELCSRLWSNVHQVWPYIHPRTASLTITQRYHKITNQLAQAVSSISEITLSDIGSIWTPQLTKISNLGRERSANN